MHGERLGEDDRRHLDVGDRAELAARHAAPQHLGEQLAAAQVEVGAVEARDVGEVAGLGQDQLDDAAQWALGEFAELADQLAQQIFGRAFEAVDHLAGRNSGPPIASTITALKSSSLFLK